MLLKDVFQVLEDDVRLAKGDEFALSGIADQHIWGPCESFVGHLVRDVSQRGRIIFRRRIARDEVQN
jgi:hypothetical protein